MNSPATPLELRKLKANMALKGLSLTDLCIKTRIPYVTISRILNGRVDLPKSLELIRNAITNEPMPVEQGQELAPA